eukprot:Lithocolla_globosa_v1_NODE_7296_length_966_cov_28.228321.p1 type:complete len:279 gc:universal NODE_7296_length_966_cov_28.228321:921-85(-)
MAAPYLLSSLKVVAAANLAGFTVTAITQSHKITDLTGTTAFIASAWMTHRMATQAAKVPLLSLTPSLLMTGCVTLWGARLASYLFSRVLALGEDARLRFLFPSSSDEPYLTGRSKYPLKLAGFWFFQSLWAYLCMVPVTVAQSSSLVCKAVKPNTSIGVGLTIFLTGFLLETMADYQKSAFKRTHGDKCIMNQLYTISRFPNYLGETMAWTGMAVMGGSVGSTFRHYPWIVVSPFFTWFVITKLTLPLTLKHQEKRYGNDPVWRAYVEKTGIIFPKLF